MRVLGIPWEEVEEAGRLEDLHRRLGVEGRPGSRRRPWEGAIDRLPWVLPFATGLLAWGATTASGWISTVMGAAAILLCFRPATFAHTTLAGKLDEFLALRGPSRGAILLARIRRAGPGILLASLSWAAAAAGRMLGAGVEAGEAWPFVVLAALLPATLSCRRVWRSVPGWKSDPGELGSSLFWFPVALVVCSLGGAVIGGSPGLSRSTSIWFLFGPLFALANGLSLAAELRRGSPPGKWGWAMVDASSRAVGVLELLVFAGLLLDPVRTSAWTGEHAPRAPFAAMALAGAALPLLLAGAVGRVGECEIPAGRKGGSEERATPIPRAGRRRVSFGRLRKPSSVFTGHLGDLRLWGYAPMGTLFLLGLGAIAVLPKVDGGWFAVAAALFIPRCIGVDHGDRAWLLGMDWTSQRRHDRRALLWMGAVPLLAVMAAALLLLYPALLPGTEPRWEILLLAAGTLAFRAGMHGWALLLRAAGVPGGGRVLCVLPAVLGLGAAGAGGGDAAAAAGAGALLAGAVGLLAETRREREEDLLRSMRNRLEGRPATPEAGAGP